MIKIQLDASALRELIGGDSEIELELRNGVVQNFARKYLKIVDLNPQYASTLLHEMATDVVKESFAMDKVENYVKSVLRHGIEKLVCSKVNKKLKMISEQIDKS